MTQPDPTTTPGVTQIRPLSGTSVTHVLWCDSNWFQRIEGGSKTFEVRRNDRGFQKGDRVHLRECTWEEAGRGLVRMPTGGEWRGLIGDVFSGGYGCDLGEFVVFSLVAELPDGFRTFINGDR